MEGGGGGRKGEPGSGAGECSSNDAIRRVMRNDVTLGAGVTVLSQGQPVQGPPALPALNPSRSLSLQLLAQTQPFSAPQDSEIFQSRFFLCFFLPFFQCSLQESSFLLIALLP